MPTVVVTGIQWGDEGKGKVADLLGLDADVVTRFQGGANAGHTVVIAGRKMVLHQVPTGILGQHASCVIGPAVVVDPETLLTELDEVAAAGLDVSPARLASRRAAPVVMPYHKAIDYLRERARGASKIGTTGRGIGPAYEDMVARTGLRMGDLCAPDRLARRLDAVLSERNPLIRHLGGEVFAPADLIRRGLEWGARLGPYLRDTGALLSERLDEGRKVLFESAQGTLLDVVHGTYPFVTSSMTTAPAAFALSGVGIPRDRRVLGILKAYTTRVGEGPFPTEDRGALGTHLREKGGEYGSTTGRPRRCGLLDLPALRYAVRTNGVDALALMKLDVLAGLDRLPVCVAYDTRDGRVDTLHPDRFGDPDVVPVCEDWEGWAADIAGIRSVEALPAEVRAFVGRVEAALGVPAAILSTGSDRADTIVLGDLWR